MTYTTDRVNLGFGTHVYCTDEECGKLAHIAVDPITHQQFPPQGWRVADKRQKMGGEGEMITYASNESENRECVGCDVGHPAP